MRTRRHLVSFLHCAPTCLATLSPILHTSMGHDQLILFSTEIWIKYWLIVSAFFHCCSYIISHCLHRLILIPKIPSAVDPLLQHSFNSWMKWWVITEVAIAELLSTSNTGTSWTKTTVCVNGTKNDVEHHHLSLTQKCFPSELLQLATQVS